MNKIIDLTSFSSVSYLKDNYNSDHCTTFTKSCYFLRQNGMNSIRQTLEKNSQDLEQANLNQSNDQKNILIIVVCIGCGLTAICYIVIIPSVLRVTRQKSNAMAFFAEIPAPEIHKLIKDAEDFSIKEIFEESTPEENDAPSPLAFDSQGEQ